MIRLKPCAPKKAVEPNYNNTATTNFNIDALTYMLRRIDFSDAYEHPENYVNSIGNPHHFMDARLPHELQMRRWGRAARRIWDERVLVAMSTPTAEPSLGDSYMRNSKAYIWLDIGGKKSWTPIVMPPTA